MSYKPCSWGKRFRRFGGAAGRSWNVWEKQPAAQHDDVIIIVIVLVFAVGIVFSSFLSIPCSLSCSSSWSMYHSPLLMHFYFCFMSVGIPCPTLSFPAYSPCFLTIYVIVVVHHTFVWSLLFFWGKTLRWQLSHNLINLLGQWLNFTLFGITYLAGKLTWSSNLYFRVHWLSELMHVPLQATYGTSNHRFQHVLFSKSAYYPWYSKYKGTWEVDGANIAWSYIGTILYIPWDSNRHENNGCLI